ncbi:MAG: KEOPS complex kinase/ATPase Bud32 [Candidatus Diapherotrites archaeon]|nr:KEOPS complex kinase/ATPase Bud32 [Candidatus Diapherotrites archaeon]
MQNFSQPVLLKKGAEAELSKAEFLGRTVLIKKRISKNYRHKNLDDKIREERRKKEVLMIQRAKNSGVRTPIVYFVDPEEKEIVMEFVSGKRMKDVLNSENLHLCRELGRMIGRLHKDGIIHGDLTTSNVLVSSNEFEVSDSEFLVLIDFGLAFDSIKDEDKATDLLNLKKTFTATHFNLMQGFEEILKEYKKESGFSEIEEKIREIEKRARYNY